MEIKRGGVYYIDNPTFTGHEMAKDRPAVVVSCDAMNCTSSVVSVVYMTGGHALPGTDKRCTERPPRGQHGPVRPHLHRGH